MIVYYNLYWVYRDGKKNSTIAGTLEIARSKAKSKTENENIGFVAIEKVELVEIVKDKLY